MLGNCLSHTQSLTNKDQREFEQLTTEEAKVNRYDYTRGRLFERMACVSKDQARSLGKLNASNKNHPLYDSATEVNNLWSNSLLFHHSPNFCCIT